MLCCVVLCCVVCCCVVLCVRDLVRVPVDECIANMDRLFVRVRKLDGFAQAILHL